MTPLQAMKQALKLLERYRNETPLGHQPHMIAHLADESITNLRTAIEEMEKVDPVAVIGTNAFKTLNTYQGHQWVSHEGLPDVVWLKPMPPVQTKLYTHPAPVPEGWQLVPVVPTEEMRRAVGNVKLVVHGYKDMLAAAPKEPT